MIVAIVLISVLLMAAFVAVAIVGNRAHDRQNARLDASRAASKKADETVNSDKNP